MELQTARFTSYTQACGACDNIIAVTKDFCDDCAIIWFKCFECDEVQKLKDGLEGEADDFYCQDCHAEHFTTCNKCTHIIDRDDATRIDEKDYCGGCYADTFTTCIDCDVVIKQDGCYTYNDQDYCVDCFDENFSNCEGCRDTLPTDDLVYHGGEEAYFCSSCYNERSDEENDENYWESETKEIPSRSFKIIKSRRKYGIELESSAFSDVQQDDTVFSSVSDGSIDGQEFVSPILQGDDGFKEVEKLCTNKIKTDVKCGFHLHLDARGYDYKKILKIARGYQKIQEFLFCLVAPSRQESSYCKRIETNFNGVVNLEQLRKALYGGDSDTGHRHKYHHKRYEFLNLHSFFHRGSIEIRLHQGTFNAEKIKNWINLHQSLFDFFLRRPCYLNALPSEVVKDFFKAYPRLKKYALGRLKKFSYRQSLPYLTVLGG